MKDGLQQVINMTRNEIPFLKVIVNETSASVRLDGEELFNTTGTANNVETALVSYLSGMYTGYVKGKESQ